MPDPTLASLLSIWEDVFAPLLTQASFANLFVVLTGWVLTDAPVHTITEALLATGVAGRSGLTRAKVLAMPIRPW